MEVIREDFFGQDPVTCARGLIGCHFVWHGCVSRIVETEAYEALDDAACHTWFRPSARAFVEAGGEALFIGGPSARRPESASPYGPVYHAGSCWRAAS
jgi:hypothetical protein